MYFFPALQRCGKCRAWIFHNCSQMDKISKEWTITISSLHMSKFLHEKWKKFNLIQETKVQVYTLSCPLSFSSPSIQPWVHRNQWRSQTPHSNFLFLNISYYCSSLSNVSYFCSSGKMKIKPFSKFNFYQHFRQ